MESRKIKLLPKQIKERDFFRKPTALSNNSHVKTAHLHYWLQSHFSNISLHHCIGSSILGPSNTDGPSLRLGCRQNNPASGDVELMKKESSL